MITSSRIEATVVENSIVIENYSGEIRFTLEDISAEYNSESQVLRATLNEDDLSEFRNSENVSFNDIEFGELECYLCEIAEESAAQ